MSDNETVSQLVHKAKLGDQVALQQLLALHASELSQFISQKCPSSQKALIDPDDILQQMFIDAFRDIGRFELRSKDAFLAWLKTIAEHRLQDAVKAGQGAQQKSLQQITRPA